LIENCQKEWEMKKSAWGWWLEQSLVQQNIDWLAYVESNGPLAKLVAEQSGDLGGPKPTFSRSMASFFQNDIGRSSAAFEQLRGLLPYASLPPAIS
jgi:hypothetical protein